MIPSNMKSQDWEMFLGKGGLQDNCIIKPPLTLTEPEKKLAKQHKKDFPDEKKSKKKIKVLSMARATSKARFFVTEEGAFHTHGFWCPDKVLIKYEPNRHVIVQDWFEPSVIEWS